MVLLVIGANINKRLGKDPSKRINNRVLQPLENKTLASKAKKTGIIVNTSLS
jgi:hypothetical protein